MPALPRPRESNAEKQLADIRLDRAWACVYRRAWALAALSADNVAMAADAQFLMGGLFTDGLGALTLPHEAEWAESKRRLAALDAEKDLAARGVRVAGAEVDGGPSRPSPQVRC